MAIFDGNGPKGKGPCFILTPVWKDSNTYVIDVVGKIPWVAQKSGCCQCESLKKKKKLGPQPIYDGKGPCFTLTPVWKDSDTYIIDVVGEILWVAQRSLDVVNVEVRLSIVGKANQHLYHFVHWDLCNDKGLEG